METKRLFGRHVPVAMALMVVAGVLALIGWMTFSAERTRLIEASGETANRLFRIEARSRAERIAGRLRDVARVSTTNARQIELALANGATVHCKTIVEILRANLRDPLVFGSCVAFVREEELEEALVDRYESAEVFARDEARSRALIVIDALRGDDMCIPNRNNRTGLFAPYVYRKNPCGSRPTPGVLEDLGQCGEYYTYDEAGRWEWFDGVRRAVAGWREARSNQADAATIAGRAVVLDGYMTLPFRDAAPDAGNPNETIGTNEMMCTFSVPILVGETFVGIATADIRLCDFMDRIFEDSISKDDECASAKPGGTNEIGASQISDVAEFIILRDRTCKAMEPWASRTPKGTFIYVSGLNSAEREQLLGVRTLSQIDQSAGESALRILSDEMTSSKGDEGIARLEYFPRIASRLTRSVSPSRLVAYYPVDFGNQRLGWSIAITASKHDPVVQLDDLILALVWNSKLFAALNVGIVVCVIGASLLVARAWRARTPTSVGQ